MNIFDTIMQGDSTSWHDDPATVNGITYTSANYALRYELRGPGAPITLNSVADGTGWKTSIDTTTSNGLTGGKWWFAAFYTATNVRIKAGEGEITVEADLTAAGANFSNLSPAETALSNAEKALATFNSSGGKVKRYQIGSRSMEFSTVQEILDIIAYWKMRVLSEKTANEIANGNGNPRRIYVGFK